MMDLQSLMDSWSLEDHDGAPRSQQQIEDLADRLKDRLEIDLGREQFRDLAAKLIQLNLEKRQTGQTHSNASTIGNGAAAASQRFQRQQQPQPTSTSTWHSPGQQNSINMNAPRTTNLQTLFDGPPPPNPAAQAPVPPPVPVPLPSTRGRQRERQTSLPFPSPRSSTPIRSFFGFGAKPAIDAAAPLQAPQHNVRARSPSPFRNLFARNSSKQYHHKACVEEEEKKEHDAFAQTDATFAAATTTDALRKSPVRGVHRHFSGRASPMLDPSAEKPFQPPRAKSPLPHKRGDSPVRMRPQVTAKLASSPLHTRRDKISPASPFHARPGLQDDDEDGEGNNLNSKSQAAATRANTTDDLSDLLYKTGFSVVSNRPNHGAEQDDDEAGQQPRPRHRKSLSEPMQLGDLDLSAFNLSQLHIHTETRTSKPEDSTNNAPVVDDDMTLPPNVTTRLTPPLQFRTPKAAEADAVGSTNAFFKTGVGKNRRKGGTPPFDTATNAPQPIFASTAAAAANSFAPPTNNVQQQQPTNMAATGAIPTQPVNSNMPFAVDNNFAPSVFGFSMGAPPMVANHNKSRGGAHKRNFRRPDLVNVAPQYNVPAPAASPPSPMEIDMMEATPPPPKFNAQRSDTAQFTIGLNIPRKQSTPTRSKASVPQNYSWHSSGQPFAATTTGGTDLPNPQAGAAFVNSESAIPELAMPLAPTQDEKRAELVAALRDEARNSYVAQDFNASIIQWTKAIQLFNEIGTNEVNDTVAVLLSNRAACFLMIEAFEPAIKDCIEALLHVSEASSTGGPFTHDSGLPLRVKLLLRLGKAYLKNGDHITSIQTLDKAIEYATKGLTLVSVTLSPSEADKCKCLLTQMVTEATLTKSDADRLADLCESIWKCVRTIQNGNAEKTDRRMYVEALAQVKNALGIACGSISLLENKATLLTTMNRWRETASFLERLACSRVPLEAVFHEVDLASHNPFPGIPKAKFLSASSFANVDEADEEFEVKLNSKACGEAVLRLPYSLTQTYLRALRLEERYPSAEAALKSLEELVERGLHVYNTSSMQSKFSWLSREYIKLNRTKKGREYGDKLFRLQDYDLAAKEYGKCLAIDGEDSGNTNSGTAGGRLHAVLYCNRAACYMALHRYSDALDECAAALRIHSRYMKALLRRARCYSRLNRCEEAIREYEKWRELAAEGKIYPKTSSGGSPCWFDLPREVTAVDVDTVLKELDEVHVIKRRMDAASREAENRRNEWQRRHENTHSQSFGRGSRPNPTAQQRRNDWRNQQNDPRHWDTFSGRNPRSGPSASSGSSGQPGFDRSRSWNNGPNVGGSHSAHQRSNIGSPGSDLSISHYVVLGIDINATARDVKKAYRAKALTEHPDKNIHDPNAADKFRRIQMAYEILSDAQTRYKYDLEQGYGRR